MNNNSPSKVESGRMVTLLWAGGFPFTDFEIVNGELALEWLNLIRKVSSFWFFSLFSASSLDISFTNHSSFARSLIFFFFGFEWEN